MAEAIVGPLVGKLQEMAVSEAKALVAVNDDIRGLRDRLMWMARCRPSCGTPIRGDATPPTSSSGCGSSRPAMWPLTPRTPLTTTPSRSTFLGIQVGASLLFVFSLDSLCKRNTRLKLHPMTFHCWHGNHLQTSLQWQKNCSYKDDQDQLVFLAGGFTSLTKLILFDVQISKLEIKKNALPELRDLEVELYPEDIKFEVYGEHEFVKKIEEVDEYLYGRITQVPVAPKKIGKLPSMKQTRG